MTDPIQQRRLRVLLRASGGVLWVMVALVGYIVWQQSERLAANERDGGKNPIVLEPSADRPPVVALDFEEPSQEPQPAEGDGDTGGQADDEAVFKIENFTLTDQLGRTVTAESLRGQPYVASFIFTRCAGYCPNLTGEVKELSDRLKGTDVRFVTITVDPEHDTVEKLKQYADVFNADPDRWVFLTGEKDEIYKLVRHGFKLMVAEQPDAPPGFEVAHSLSLIHVNEEGVVEGKYDSRDEQDLLALRRVLEGKIETPEENRPTPPAPEIRLDADPAGPAPAQSEGAALEGQDDADARAFAAAPQWVRTLPAVNAGLNGLATLLLLGGFAAVMTRHLHIHRNLMLTAFAVSIAFLVCYLVYHFGLHYYTGSSGKKFTGTGASRTVYFSILISHVVLAAAVPVLALLTMYRALRGEFDRHRRIARVTFPIWLYVSVTGVIIYAMLYHWPVGIA